jgi:hypothetical protein
VPDIGQSSAVWPASLYRAALAMGYGDADTASVCAVLERMAGIERGKPR